MNTHQAYDLALRDHDQLPVVAFGCAGTGKTYGAVGAAAEWLKQGRHNKVLVTRPNVSFAEKNGFLPGTEREKMEPWIRPIQQNFEFHGVKAGEQAYLEKSGKIVYMPLEYVQGLTWDNTFIICDECQNMTFEQIKVFVTRAGKYSKVVLCGDIAQISPKFKDSGLAEYLRMVEHFNARVHTIEFTRDDIMRSELCKEQIIMFEEWEKLNG
ncbi:MAG: PhoH family protein [Bacteroidota bacterium]